MSIQAMKMALYFLDRLQFDERDPEHVAAITALRAAITEAEKCEPVAEVTCFGHDADIHPMITYNARLMCNFEAGNYHLYTTPQPAIPAGYALVPVELPDKARQAIWVQGWNEVDDFWKRCLEELAAAPKPGDKE